MNSRTKTIKINNIALLSCCFLATIMGCGHQNQVYLTWKVLVLIVFSSLYNNLTNLVCKSSKVFKILSSMNEKLWCYHHFKHFWILLSISYFSRTFIYLTNWLCSLWFTVYFPIILCLSSKPNIITNVIMSPAALKINYHVLTVIIGLISAVLWVQTN